MAISCQCPGCQSKLAFDERLLGKKVRCKKCSHVFVVEAATENKGAAIQKPPRRERVVADQEDEELPAPPRKRKRNDDPIPSLRRTRWGLYLGLGMAGLALVLLGVTLLLVLIYFRSSGNGLASVFDREFSGSWPVPNSPAGFGVNLPEDTIVTLHIAGVVNQETSDSIQAKAAKLADGGGHAHMESALLGDRMTVRLGPARDPQACASRIDFGEVRGVDGRVIKVVAHKVEGLPANADAVTKALHDLQSPSFVRRSEAAKRLKTMIPNERRNEVARALEACLKDPNPFLQEEVLKALGVWGTKDSVPALLDALATSHPPTSWAILSTLAHFPDERVCELLAQHLEELSDGRTAAEALKTIGSMAEKAVLKRLSHPEVFIRQEVCQILLVIGTKESLPALRIAAGDFFTKDEAEKAIRAIQAREKAGK